MATFPQHQHYKSRTHAHWNSLLFSESASCFSKPLKMSAVLKQSCHISFIIFFSLTGLKLIFFSSIFQIFFFFFLDFRTRLHTDLNLSSGWEWVCVPDWGKFGRTYAIHHLYSLRNIFRRSLGVWSAQEEKWSNQKVEQKDISPVCAPQPTHPLKTTTWNLWG